MPGPAPGITQTLSGSDKARLAVIRLLIRDTIKPDRPCARMRDRILPRAQANPFAAPVGAAQIQAQKGIFRVVINDRDCRNRCVGHAGQEEPAGVGGMKGGCIVQTGVPSLVGRPTENRFQPRDTHCVDRQIIVHRTIPLRIDPSGLAGNARVFNALSRTMRQLLPVGKAEFCLHLCSDQFRIIPNLDLPACCPHMGLSAQEACHVHSN